MIEPRRPGREHEVEAAFVRWLESEREQVRTHVDWADVVVERGDERLVAEAKGITTSVGTDLDTRYWQLLRRMINPGARYAVVVPDRLVPAALRGAGRGSGAPQHRRVLRWDGRHGHEALSTVSGRTRRR